MAKRYKLLKDLPYVKAGAIYEWTGGEYTCNSETAQYTEGTKWDALGKDAVEKAADGWFEEIKEEPEQPFVWTDELVREFFDYYNDKFYLSKFPQALISFKQFKKEKSTLSKKEDAEWEILKLIHKNGSISMWSSGRGYTIEELTKEDGWNIYSVRRLSDGEVFTIGDDVIHFEGTYYETIKSFVIPNNIEGQIWFNPESIPDCVKNLSNFNKIKPPPSSSNDKEPLFTTEDGKDIFIGTSYWSINIRRKGEKAFEYFGYSKPGDYLINLKHFSTEQAAYDYVKKLFPEGEPPCHICGGETVLVRGKYPECDKRNVCPTCTTERLEQIQEISNPNYGQACKNN